MKKSASRFWTILPLVALLPMGCEILPVGSSPLTDAEITRIQGAVEGYLSTSWIPSLNRRWDAISAEASASVGQTSDLLDLIEQRVEFLGQIDAALEELVAEIRGSVQVARGESLFDDLAEQRIRESVQNRREEVRAAVIRAIVGSSGTEDPLSQFTPATLDLLQRQFAKQTERGSRILLLRVLLSPGFARGLTEAEQQKLFLLIGGRNDHFGKPARKRILTWLDDAGTPWDGRSAEDQTRLLRDFLTNPSYLPFRSIGFSNPGPSSPYQMEAPVVVGEEVGFWYFVDGDADGTQDVVKSSTRYDLVFPESTVTVWMQDNPHGQPQSALEDVARAIAALPPMIRGWIPGIRINAAENRTAMATTGSDGLVDLYNRYTAAEIGDTLLHEAGHCFSNKTSKGAFSFVQWEQAMAADSMWVSLYGNKNSHEDFSESINLFVRIHMSGLLGEIAPLLPHRFSMLHSLCGDQADCPFAE